MRKIKDTISVKINLTITIIKIKQPCAVIKDKSKSRETGFKMQN